jgi:hypothetical protein
MTKAIDILCKFRHFQEMHIYSQWLFWKGYANDFDIFCIRISHESPVSISLSLIVLGMRIKIYFSAR